MEAKCFDICGGNLLKTCCLGSPFLQTDYFYIANQLTRYKPILDKTCPKDHNRKISVKVPATSFVQWVLGRSSN